MDREPVALSIQDASADQGAFIEAAPVKRVTINRFELKVTQDAVSCVVEALRDSESREPASLARSVTLKHFLDHLSSVNAAIVRSYVDVLMFDLDGEEMVCLIRDLARQCENLQPQDDGRVAAFLKTMLDAACSNFLAKYPSEKMLKGFENKSFDQLQAYAFLFKSSPVLEDQLEIFERLKAAKLLERARAPFQDMLMALNPFNAEKFNAALVRLTYEFDLSSDDRAGYQMLVDLFSSAMQEMAREDKDKLLAQLVQPLREKGETKLDVYTSFLDRDMLAEAAIEADRQLLFVEPVIWR